MYYDTVGHCVCSVLGEAQVVVLTLSCVPTEGCGHTTTAEKQKIALKKEAESESPDYCVTKWHYAQ